MAWMSASLQSRGYVVSDKSVLQPSTLVRQHQTTEGAQGDEGGPSLTDGPLFMAVVEEHRIGLTA